MTIRDSVKRMTPAWFRNAAAMMERGVIRTVKWFQPPRRSRSSDGRVMLNLGCGYVSHPSFINVDALTAWHIDYIRPVDDLRPFASNSVDLVYVSHCLEHISHLRVNDVLSEWRRVLKPGGVLRLGVPDFDGIVELYHAKGSDIEAIQLILMGGQNYPLNCHLSAYTHRGLSDRLKKVGFSEVRKWVHGSDELTSLADFTSLAATVGDRVIPLSLNLEAIK